MEDHVREKISRSRKKYLSENPEKHPWKRSTKFKSEPCERVKEFLRSRDIVFVEEWQPLDDRFYSIDIAFPDIKYGIEINGNQHYERDGTLRPYYQERHDRIVQAGWTLLELHYTSCYNLELIEKLLAKRTQPDYSEYFKKQKEREERRNNIESRGVKIRRKSDERWEPYKQIVVDSDIEFDKFGWVKHVADLLGIKNQKVNKWMKRYLPEFYETQCYKRKPH